MKISTWNEYQLLVNNLENKILDELQISNLKVAGNHFVTLESLTIRKLIIDGDCYFNLSLSECEIDKF